MAQKEVTIAITTGTIIKTVLILVLLGVLFLVRDTVLLVLAAVIIAASVEPFANWFIKRRIPRVIAVLFIYIATVALISATFYFIFIPLLGEATTFLKTTPQQLTTQNILGPVSNYLGGTQGQVVKGFSQKLSLGDMTTGLNQLTSHFSGGLVSTLDAVFGGVFSTIFVLVLSFYLAVQHDGVIQFLRMITPLRYRSYVLDLWKRSERKIGLWMQGQLLLSVLIAVLSYLGLIFLGVPYALLLAVLSGLFELIPLFGLALSGVLPVVVALSTGGITLALLVVGLYVIISQFENHLIYPIVVRKVVGVPTTVVIIALIVGGQLAGFLGILIAVPVAAILMEFIKDIQKKHLEEEIKKE